MLIIIIPKCYYYYYYHYHNHHRKQSTRAQYQISVSRSFCSISRNISFMLPMTQTLNRWPLTQGFAIPSQANSYEIGGKQNWQWDRNFCKCFEILLLVSTQQYFTFNPIMYHQRFIILTTESLVWKHTSKNISYIQFPYCNIRIYIPS